MSDNKQLELESDYEALKAEAKTASKAKNYEQALELSLEALELNPQSHDALINLGDAYLDLDQYEKAEHSYRKALKLQPDSWRALHDIGSSFRRRKSYIEAIYWFKKALCIASEEFSAPFNLGRCYDELGMHEQAESYLREAISKKIKDSAGYYCLGECLYSQGNFKKALYVILQGEPFLDGRPELKSAYPRLLAFLYYKLEQPRQAISIYQKYLENFPEKDFFYYESILYMARSYLQNQQANEAFQTLESLNYNIDDKNECLELFYRTYTDVYEASGDYPHACGYAIELAKHKPDNIYYNWKAGQMCIRNTSVDLAIRYLEKGMELEPSEVFYWRDKAYCLLSLEKIPEAISFLNEAVNTWPEERYLIERLADTYCVVKEPDFALSCIAKAESLGSQSLSLQCVKACSFFMKNEIETALAISKALVLLPNWQDDCNESDIGFLKEQLKLNGIQDFESLKSS